MLTQPIHVLLGTEVTHLWGKYISIWAAASARSHSFSSADSQTWGRREGRSSSSKYCSKLSSYIWTSTPESHQRAGSQRCSTQVYKALVWPQCQKANKHVTGDELVSSWPAFVKPWTQLQEKGKQTNSYGNKKWKWHQELMTMISIVRKNILKLELAWNILTAAHSCEGRIQESPGYMDYHKITTNCASKNKVLTTEQPGLYNSSHSENLPSKYNSPIQNNYI